MEKKLNCLNEAGKNKNSISSKVNFVVKTKPMIRKNFLVFVIVDRSWNFSLILYLKRKFG